MEYRHYALKCNSVADWLTDSPAVVHYANATDGLNGAMVTQPRLIQFDRRRAPAFNVIAGAGGRTENNQFDLPLEEAPSNAGIQLL